MPDQNLVPSEEIQKILLEPDLWDSGFSEVELTESYSDKRRQWISQYIRQAGRIKMIGVSVIPPALGVLFGLSTDSILKGATAGVIVLLVEILLIYLFYAPREVYEAVRENLRAAHNQLREEKAKTKRVAALALQLTQIRDVIQIKIKDVCDQMHLPLHEGFRFDRRIFVRLHLVNKGTETNIQQFAARLWVDGVDYEGKQKAASGYQLLVEEQYRDPKEMNPSVRTLKTDLIDLEDTKADPLKPRIGREGWVSFLFNNVEIEIVDDYKLKVAATRLEITIIDGNGESHKEEIEGPWECSGKIVEGPPKPIEWEPLGGPFDAFR